MKKFKKLIPALCMLLVSAVMLGSTTFAWFSMNKTVTATGMEIKAEVSTQLLIKGSATSAAYKSAIDFSGADSAVGAKNKLNTVPATAYKGRNEEATAALIKNAEGWKKLKKTDSVQDDGTIAGGAQDSTWDNNTAIFEAATAGTDYIKDDFTLKLVGEYKATATMKLTLTATTENEAGNLAATGEGKVQVSPIYKAIHVAVAATYTSGTYLKEIDLGTGTTIVYAEDGKKATITVEVTDFDKFTKANEEHSYSIYIWYDGEDSDCKNSNAANIDLFKFALNFEYVEA